MANSNTSGNSSIKKSFELPKYISNTVKFLEFFSGNLALKFALKLFFSPIKFKRPEREDKLYSAARKSILKNNLGNDFELMVWGEENEKSILLVHGWSGRGTQFHKLIEELLKHKWKVISFNAPAHGFSKQKQTSLLEFTYCCLQITNELGPIDFAIGHSLGSGALLNALDQGSNFKKIVSIGTPATIGMVVEDFSKLIGGSPKIASGILKHIENNFKVDVSKISSNYLAEKYNPEGLILHDAEDADVPVKNAQLLHKSWTNSSLHLSSGLGHRKILNHEDSISRIIAFLESDVA